MASERKGALTDRHILQQRVRELEAAYNTSQRKKDELTQELVAAEDKIGQLEKKLAANPKTGNKSTSAYELSRRYQTLEKKNAELLDQDAEKDRHVSELLEQLKETQSISAEKDRLLERLRNQVEKLSKQVNVIQGEKEELQEKLSKEKSVNEDFENDRKRWFASISAILADVKKSRKDTSLRSPEPPDGESVDSVLRQIHSEIQQMQAVLGTESVFRYKTEVDKLTAELGAKEAEIKSLQSTLASNETSVLDAQKEVNQQANRGLSDELQRSQEKYRARRRTSSESDTNVSDFKQRQLEDRIRELTVENARIRSEKEKVDNAIESLKKEWLQLQDKLKIQEKIDQKLENDRSEEQLKIIDGTISARELQKNNIAQRKIIEELKEMQEVNNRKYKALEASSSKLEKQLRETIRENEQLKKEEESLREDLSIERERVKSILQEQHEDSLQDFERNEELQKLNERVLQLDQNVLSLREDNSKLTERLKYAEGERNTIVAKDKEKSSLVQTLREELSQLQVKMDQVKSEKRKLQKGLEESRHADSQLTESNKSLLLEFDKLKNSRQDLEKQCNEYKEVNDTLSQHLNERNKKLERVEEDIKNLTKKNAQLVKELEIEKNQTKVSQKDTESIQMRATKAHSVQEQLNKVIFEREQEIAELRDMEEKLIQNNTELEEALAEVRMNVQQLKGTNEELQAKCALQQMMVTGKEKRIHELEIELKALTEQQERLRHQIKEISESMTGKEEILKRLQEESKTINKLLTQSDKTRETMEKELGIARKEKEEANRKLTEVMATHVNIEALNDKERLLNENLNYSKDLSNKLQTYKQKINELGSELSNKNAELDLLTKEKGSLIAKNNEYVLQLNKEIDSWRSESSVLREAKEKLENEVMLARKEASRVSKDLENSKELEKNVTSLFKEAQRTVGDLEKRLKERDGLYAIERQAREELEEEIQHYKRKVSAAQKFEEKGKESRLMLQKELSQSLEKFESTSSKLSYMQEELNKARNLISELEVDKALKEDTEKENSELRAKLMKSIAEADVMRDEQERLADAGNRKEQRLTELEKLLKTSQENEGRLKILMKQAEEDFVSKDAYERLKKELNDKVDQLECSLQETGALRNNLKEIGQRADLMSQEKKNLERSVSELVSELEVLKSKGEKSRQTVDATSRKLSDCQRQLALVSNANRNLEEELKELKGQNINLKTEFETMRLTYQEQQQELDGLNSEYTEVKMRSEERDSDYSRLQDKVFANDKQIANLQKTNERLDRKIISLRNENVDLEEAVRNMNLKNAELTKKLEEINSVKESLKATVEDCTMQVEALEGQVQSSRKEIGRKAARIEELVDEIDNLRSTRTKEERTSEDLRNQVKEGNERIEGLKCTIAELRDKERETFHDFQICSSEVDNKTAELAKMKSKVEELQDLLQTEKSERTKESKEASNWKEDYNDLWLKYEECKGHCDTAKDEIQQLKTKSRELEKEVNALKQEKENLRGEIVVTENKVVALNLGIEKAKKQKEQLMGDLNVARKRGSEIEASFEENKQELIKKVVETESQLTSLTDKFEDVMNRFKDSQRQVAEQFKNLSELRIAHEQLTKSELQAKRSVEELSSLLKTKTQDAESLKRELERVSSELDKAFKTLQEKEMEVKDLSLKNTRANESIEDFKKAHVEFQANLAQLEDENKSLKNELRLRGREMQNSVSSASELGAKVKALKEQLTVAEKRFRGLQGEKQILKREYDDALTDLDTTKKQLVELKKDRDDIHGELEVSKKDMAILQRTITTLEERVQLQEVQLREKEKTLKENESNKMILRRKIMTLEEEKKVLTDECNRASATNKKLGEEKIGLVREHTMAAAIADEYKESDIALRREIDRLNQLCLVKEEEINHLHNEEKSCRQDLRAEQQEKSKLDWQLMLRVAEVEKLRNELGVSNRKLSEMREQLSVDLSTQHAELLKTKAEKDFLQEELSKRSRNGNVAELGRQLEKERSEIRSEFENEIKTLKDQLEGKNKTEISLKSELKIAKNKLAIYVKEREKWEEKVKSVVAEIEREKTRNEHRERELLALQARLEKENEYAQKRLTMLEQESGSTRQAYEQQLESEKTRRDLELETRKLEIESLRRQLSLQNAEHSGSWFEWEESKTQLLKRNEQLEELKSEIAAMRDRHQLEVTILRNEAQSFRMEYQLLVHRNTVSSTKQSKDHEEKIKELAETLQRTKRESEKLKAELKSKYGRKI